MSAQFGHWNFEGCPLPQASLQKVMYLLTPYGPDGNRLYSSNGIDICYAAHRTTKEAHREIQPLLLSSGAVVTWDGRLDNRADLIGYAESNLSLDSPDVAIVGAAYLRWGLPSLSRLIGDWALSIWHPSSRSLLLAKDYMGSRQLYYSCDETGITWSSVLDPLIANSTKTFALDEEYVAGWFSFLPAPQLTPYRGLHSVPPASYVLLNRHRSSVHRYWKFDSTKRIRCVSDEEYEERFRLVFQESVRRRVRCDASVLAELSGGMDSSSIVCIADALVADGCTELPRLDTVSYWDDSEPNWNELPFLMKVEEQRGRPGFHIDFAEGDEIAPEGISPIFAATPSAIQRPRTAARKFEDHLRSGGYRVVLSGIGGDEVLGGVPTPFPELANLLARGRFRAFARRTTQWALSKREPLVHLLWQTARLFLPTQLLSPQLHQRPLPWIAPDFAKRHRWILEGCPRRLRLFGPLPSFQNAEHTLDILRQQIATFLPPTDPPYEIRYPYLDRDLLEFLFAVPREQLVRPGQRRSLMRRSLAGVVPEQVLNRKRKAFVTRTPLSRVWSDYQFLQAAGSRMISDSLGIVNEGVFADALGRARRGERAHIVGMMRTVQFEFWLRNISAKLDPLTCRLVTEISEKAVTSRPTAESRA
jgi:asparagine synthase (glutamine-hydrolysing)